MCSSSTRLDVLRLLSQDNIIKITENVNIFYCWYHKGYYVNAHSASLLTQKAEREANGKPRKARESQATLAIVPDLELSVI